jgi:hypothetical protein
MDVSCLHLCLADSPPLEAVTDPQSPLVVHFRVGLGVVLSSFQFEPQLPKVVSALAALVDSGNHFYSESMLFPT